MRCPRCVCVGFCNTVGGKLNRRLIPSGHICLSNQNNWDWWTVLLPSSCQHISNCYNIPRLFKLLKCAVRFCGYFDKGMDRPTAFLFFSKLTRFTRKTDFNNSKSGNAVARPCRMRSCSIIIDERLSWTGPLFKIIEMFSTCVRGLRRVSANLGAGVAAVRPLGGPVTSVGGVGAVAGVVRVVRTGLGCCARRGHVRRGRGGGPRSRGTRLPRVHIPCNVTCQQHADFSVMFCHYSKKKTKIKGNFRCYILFFFVLTRWASRSAVLGHVPAVPACGAAARAWT